MTSQARRMFGSDGFLLTADECILPVAAGALARGRRASMTGRALDGWRILVIEDDYYLATDEQTALQTAGAQVVGPCARASEAMLLVDGGNVDCALVDINLGHGPSFEAAAVLRARGIPFLFTTGYDAATIPGEFADVARLEKPIGDKELIEAIAQLRPNHAGT